MKTIFDYGNGIKITIDQTDGDIDEPVDCSCCGGYEAAPDEVIKLREENIELNHKLDILRSELRRYFESHSDGSSNEAYDPDYTAQEVVDAVADVVEDW